MARRNPGTRKRVIATKRAAVRVENILYKAAEILDEFLHENCSKTDPGRFISEANDVSRKVVDEACEAWLKCQDFGVGRP